MDNRLCHMIVSSRRFVCMGGLCLLLLTVGCEDRKAPTPPVPPKGASSEASKHHSNTASSKPATTPGEAGVQNMDAETFTGRIASAQSLLEWYQIRQACPPALGADPRVNSALAGKEAELRDQADIEKMNDCVDLVDFRWDMEKQIQPKMAQFTVTCLLYVKSKPDLEAGEKEVWLSLRGTVESSKVVLLPTPKEKERGYIEFAIKGLKPEEWEEGEYVALSRTVEYPNLSYYFSGIIVWKHGEDWEDWTDRVNLGWYTDLD